MGVKVREGVQVGIGVGEGVAVRRSVRDGLKVKVGVRLGLYWADNEVVDVSVRVPSSVMWTVPVGGEGVLL